MRGRRFGILVVCLAAFAGGRAARGADVATKAPDPKAAGKLYEWKSAGGILCWWRAPQRYDEATGANLTLILHGSNLTHEWGFANHDHKTFRPDDFVVSPDGTTPNGKGGFNFLKEDTKKVHGLVEGRCQTQNATLRFVSDTFRSFRQWRSGSTIETTKSRMISHSRTSIRFVEARSKSLP
jgi:hypothetical protein